MRGCRSSTIIDAEAKSCRYTPESLTIMPAFVLHPQWTKQQMIDLYHQSANARESGVVYSGRSLGNKSVARVVTELCGFIRKRSGR